MGFLERSVAIHGNFEDIFVVWKGLDAVDSLVINFPIVAWKRVIFTPLLAFVMALARRKKTILVAHEWDDLDWRRRLILGSLTLFAKQIMLSSPMVREQYLRSGFARIVRTRASIVPIPPNIERVRVAVPSLLAQEIRMRRENKIVIGHFGSIYPKKQCDFVLLVAAEMKKMGRDVLVVFVGSFVKGLDRVEEDFYEQLDLLGLRNDVIMTGYVEHSGEIFAVFDEVDCFIYRFSEGLSSRRASVLTCLQTGKPVWVNAPAGADEFFHHRIFSFALENNILRLLPANADAKAYATALATASPKERSRPIEMFEATWRDAARALEEASAALIR
jgi:glycosyltransferase involved in cell wall biosynthesis